MNFNLLLIFLVGCIFLTVSAKVMPIRSELRVAPAECKADGYYPNPNETECTTYILCKKVKELIYISKFECPNGTFFNPGNTYCESDYQCVILNKHKVTPTTTMPTTTTISTTITTTTTEEPTTIPSTTFKPPRLLYTTPQSFNRIRLINRKQKLYLRPIYAYGDPVNLIAKPIAINHYQKPLYPVINYANIHNIPQPIRETDVEDKVEPKRNKTADYDPMMEQLKNITESLKQSYSMSALVMKMSINFLKAALNPNGVAPNDQQTKPCSVTLRPVMLPPAVEANLQIPTTERSSRVQFTKKAIVLLIISYVISILNMILRLAINIWGVEC